MLFLDSNNKHSLFLEGPAGRLETETVSPLHAHIPKTVVIVCHPHPLHHGTMNNKVVTMTAKALFERGFYTLRFNFRGVGNSQGEYGNLIGEVEDLLAIFKHVQTEKPKAKIWLAGFSFGGYIAAKVASMRTIDQLITIAPSVVNMPYSTLDPVHCPWTVIMGDQDEVVDFQAVIHWYEHLKANKHFVVLKGASHFFHGRLMELKESVQNLCKDFTQPGD